MKRCRLLALVMVAVLAWSRGGMAGTKTWQAGAGNWEDGANWGDVVPQPGDDVYITNTSASVVLSNATPVLSSLTLSKMLTFTNWTTSLSASNVTIQSGGRMELPAAFTESQMSNRVWIVCTNLTIAQGGAIEVTGKGYAGGPRNSAGYGPGKGSAPTRGGGGGYGGRGGWSYSANWTSSGGIKYGVVSNPEQPGSGGGAPNFAGTGGGAGGGAVRIQAGGDVVVDGSIVANGGNAANYSGGGSGGGISIGCGRFGGGGLLSANGGALNQNGGGGAGGRIAVDYGSLIGTPTARFEVKEAACVLPMWDSMARWTDLRWVAEAGTVWFPDTNLLVQPLKTLHGNLVIPGFTSWTPSSLTVSNGVVGLEPGFRLQIAGALTVGAAGGLEMGTNSYLSSGGDLLLDGGRLVMNVFTQMDCSANLVLTNGGKFYAYSGEETGSATCGAQVIVAGDIRVAPSSWILPTTSLTTGRPVRFRSANVQVRAAGGFDANGRGFSGGFITARDGWGPGGGKQGTGAPNYGSGAGYGGQGGWGWWNNLWGLSGGSAYGNTNAPVAPGSGGGNFPAGVGGNGGGVVWIEASNAVRLDGTMKANASQAVYYSGGGAGGGIFICTPRFSGAAGASFSANGSDKANDGGPGGGGRIGIAIGLGDAAREALIAGSAVPGLYVYYPDTAYAGAVSLGVGAGPNYTGEEWRAPKPGTIEYVTTNVVLSIVGNPANYGSPVPAGYGATPYIEPGSSVTNRVASPADEAAGTRHACIGWQLVDAAGGAVDSRVSTQAVFQLSATRVLTWRWTNEYLLAVQPGADGSVTTNLSGWYTNGTVVSDITATPSNGFAFERWTGDYPAGQETDNPLTVTMDRPRTLTPVFASASGQTKVWTGFGDWESAGNWDPSGMPGAYDMAVIKSGTCVVSLARQTMSVIVSNGASVLFTNWTASLTASNVTVLGGGQIGLPPPFTESQMSNRVWIVCTNLTVSSGGVIDASGRGYRGGANNTAGYGPGKGAGGGHGGGGGYGGRGGWGQTAGGNTYGAAADPSAPGSGGGTYPDALSIGGAGGGAIRIEASGDVIVAGMIVANGTNATRYAGGGSGGGIYIACDRFGGGGAIRANGGLLAHSGGGGGGGRIALDYRSLIGSPSIRIEAREAVSQLPLWDYKLRWSQYTWTAEPGSTHLPDTGLLYPTITNLHGYVTIAGVSAWAPASLAVSNGLVGLGPGFDLQVAGNLTVGSGGALELQGGSYLGCGGDLLLDGGRLVMNVFTQLDCSADLVLTNGGVFYAYSAPTNGTERNGASVNVAGDIRVGPSSWILPAASFTNGGAVRFRADDIVVAANGGFNAEGHGWAGGWDNVRKSGYGPGAGPCNVYGSGGGYGGRGGDAWENTAWGLAGGSPYGSSNAPVEPGSGGGCYSTGYGGHGGGVIWLEALNSVTLNGTLNANGGTAGYYSGGGSGGGIFVWTPRFSGSASGRLSANGSNGGNNGGPGGGGRIAVVPGRPAADRDKLLAGQPVPLLYVTNYYAYAGTMTAGFGTGIDYTGAESHAPTAGTAYFLKSGVQGTVILIR